MVGAPASTLQSTMQALSLTASRKNIPLNFKEAFSKVLLNETGVKLTSGAVNHESMARELELALRLSDAGEAPDLLAGPPRERGEADSWSADAQELRKLVEKLGPRNPNLSSELFLKPFFRNLALPKLSIRELDDDLSRFTKLTFLDVSRNSLTSIDHLPPNLKYLKAYNNPISQISCRPGPALAFLGLGHSRLGADGLEQAARRFKNLLSLDASFSEVAGLQELVAPLAPLPKLRHLCLTGSPVTLLPFYRLQVLRWLPQLHVLDGAAATEAEQADVQLLASWETPVQPRPATIRFGIQLKRLLGARALLEHLAEEILSARPEAEGEGGAEAPEDEIVAACGGGSLGLRFELPDGSWALTSEYRFRSAEELTSIAAAAPEGSPRPLDEIFLAGTGTPDGEPLYFDLDVGEEGSEVHGEVLQEDGLLRLCRWIRKGLAVKLFFREAPPPPAEGEAPAEAAEAAEGEAVARTPTLPKEVELGGAVLSLDGFLGRGAGELGAAARAAAALPDVPEPWHLDVQDAQIVLEKDFLQPQVQVPAPDSKAARKARAAAGDGRAALQLALALHAGEAPPLEEEPPPAVADPKAKAKAKK